MFSKFKRNQGGGSIRGEPRLALTPVPSPRSVPAPAPEAEPAAASEQPVALLPAVPAPVQPMPLSPALAELVDPPVPDAPRPGAALSIIGAGVYFAGQLVSDGDVWIDGRAEGNFLAGTLTIGSEGALNAELQCDVLAVKGVFTGNLQCNDLIVARGGRVRGRLVYRAIAVERGGSIAADLTYDAAGGGA